MKGGHAFSGPPPDPNALRRERDSGGWTTLPAAGRADETPSWPLSRATKRELEVWVREWRRPQALMWERNGQEDEVALYVRALVTAEKRDASVASRTLVKQLQEALGLSLPGLLRLRWRIEDVPTGAAPVSSSAPVASAKGRFRVLSGGDESA